MNSHTAQPMPERVSLVLRGRQERTSRRSRLGVVLLSVALLVLLMAPAAQATSEGGYKACSASSHVYTKAKWKTSYSAWLDITADGIREKTDSDTNGGVWEIDYMNLYGWGSVYTWINSAYYNIWGSTLSTWNSWPGCQAD